MRRFQLFGLVPVRWSFAAVSVGLMFECRSFDSTDAPDPSTAGTSSVASAGAAGHGGGGQDGGDGGDFEPEGGSHPLPAGAGGVDTVGGEAGSTGTGSEVGGAGNSSEGGTAGNAYGGGGSDGGVGSHDSEGGASGAATDGVDEITEPGCFDAGGVDGWPEVSFEWTPDVSIWRGYNNGMHVVAPQPTPNFVALRWQSAPLPDIAWSSWRCFGAFPSPDRVAAARLNNGNFAVFASSTDGRLWSRFAFPKWGPWLPLTSAPGTGPIADLDFIVAGGEPNRVYAARSGRVFVRAATSAEPYASFDSWRQIAVLDAAAIAACPLGARSDRVFVATTQGGLSTASIDVEAMTASQWSALDPVEFEGASAISCVLNEEQAPQLFASDSLGNVWRSNLPFEDWELAAETVGKVRSLDAAEVPGDDPLLAVVDEDGGVRFWQNQIQGWSY